LKQSKQVKRLKSRKEHLHGFKKLLINREKKRFSNSEIRPQRALCHHPRPCLSTKKSNCLQNEVDKIAYFPLLFAPFGNVIVNNDERLHEGPTSQIFADKQRSANYQIGWQVNRDSRAIHKECSRR
jgi:hypothetical protein